MTIPETTLRTCLAALERHAAHPSTPQLHDPIYGLLDGPSDSLEAALAQALMAHASHPAAAQLREALAEYVSVEEADLASVLARYGPVPGDIGLVAEVDRRLERADSAQRRMRRHIGHLEDTLGHLQRSSNALAALGAFVLLFTLVGWAIALGILDVQWLDTPVPADLDQARSGQGSPPIEQSARP